jgi:hypothetical protein
MTYDSEIAADSPWFYGKTDEASGSLLDSSGSSRTATLPGGSPTYAQTGPGGAADAQSWPDSSGGTEYYALTSASPGATATWTLECWVYLTATPTNATGLVAIAYGYGNTSKRPLQLYVDTDGKVKLWGGSSSTNAWSSSVAASSALSLNAWHHVVAKTTSSTQTLRVDKTQVGTGSNTTSVTTTDAIFVHGGGAQNGGADLTNSSAAKISKPAVYLSTLSDARIDAHYNAMISGDATVTAVAATATAAGVAPTVSAASAVVPPAATATATAVVPVVSAGSSVAPPAATATGAAAVPTLSADASVTPPAATATATALAPNVGVVADATVAAVPATATADAVAPSVSAGSSVAGVAATATADAVAPTLAYGSTIAVPAATATAAALAPFVDNGSPDRTVFAVPATATATAVAPVWTQVLEAGTDTSNGLDGRRRDGYATVTITYPDATVPDGVSLTEKRDKALAYPTPTMVNGRPT